MSRPSTGAQQQGRAALVYQQQQEREQLIMKQLDFVANATSSSTPTMSVAGASDSATGGKAPASARRGAGNRNAPRPEEQPPIVGGDVDVNDADQRDTDRDRNPEDDGDYDDDRDDRDGNGDGEAGIMGIGDRDILLDSSNNNSGIDNISDARNSEYQDEEYRGFGDYYDYEDGDGGGDELRLRMPKVPKWAFTRSNITGDFVKADFFPAVHSSAQVAPSLKGIPLQSQELLIMGDLLYVLVGIEGSYIRGVLHSDAQHPRGKLKLSFEVDDSTDIGIRSLVDRILPCGVFYVSVRQFCSASQWYHCGLVCHALAAAIDQLLLKYCVLIAQLEHELRQGALTLQKMMFYLHDSLHTLSLLNMLAEEATAKKARGGSLLNVISRLWVTQGGDECSDKLFLFLMQQASVPYLNFVKQWICEGLVDDPFHEFFVEQRLQNPSEQQVLSTLEFVQQFSICEVMVPDFLAEWKEKILTTGKQLNVIRECGEAIKYNDLEQLVYSPNSCSYAEIINKTFSFASKSLLNLLMHKHKLLACLKSIKSYFLLAQGDFLVHFMDTAEEELRKNYRDIQQSKLDALLELSLRSSAAESDPFRDNLQCDLLPYSNINMLLSVLHVDSKGVVQLRSGDSLPQSEKISGLEAFTLDFLVKFPLSLVINNSAIAKYQFIFRHLFMLKHVERCLNSSWVNLMAIKGQGSGLHKIHTLRQQMIHLLQNFLFFIVYEVLEPNWHKFIQQINSTASTVDEVIQLHNDFLDTCLVQCNLTDPHLVKIVTRLVAHCLKFAKHADSLSRELRSAISTAKSSTLPGVPPLSTTNTQQPLPPGAPGARHPAPQGPSTTTTNPASTSTSSTAASRVLTRNSQLVTQYMSTQHGVTTLATLSNLADSYNTSLRQLLTTLHTRRGGNPGMAHLAMCLDYNEYHLSHNPDSSGASANYSEQELALALSLPPPPPPAPAQQQQQQHHHHH
ncbi:gamma-tubulin complex component 2 [Pelomyxa schiedti]|nr:gamma-tubulin complex component 2 [Pelomyxa schiedti]